MPRPIAFTLGLVLAAVAIPAQRNPGNARGAWTLLAARHDANHDGKISADEYDRGTAKFAALDRDGDGVLTAADFEAAGARGADRAGRGTRPQPTPAQRALTRLGADADTDRDGILSRGEWKTLAEDPDAARRGAPRGAPSAEDLLAAFDAADADHDGKLDLEDLRRATPAAGPMRVPKVGDVAPDFDLPTLADAEQTIKLSGFAGSKPVALIFGSYT